MNQFLNFMTKRTKQVWVQIKANTGLLINLLKIFVHYTYTGRKYFIMSLTNKFPSSDQILNLLLD